MGTSVSSLASLHVVWVCLVGDRECEKRSQAPLTRSIPMLWTGVLIRQNLACLIYVQPVFQLNSDVLRMVAYLQVELLV